MSKRIRLICLDFDGTLVDPVLRKDVFAQDAIAVLNALPRHTQWCTNSGRHVEGQMGLIKNSVGAGLRRLPIALMCQESEIYTRRHQSYMPLTTWNRVAAGRAEEFHRRLQAELRAELDDWMETYAPDAIHMRRRATVFVLRDKAEKADRLVEDLNELIGTFSRGWVTRNGAWIAAVPEGLGKGNLLRAYAEARRISPEHILVIGDHYNDISMLDGSGGRLVGCPGDAVDAVKDIVLRAGGYVAKAPSTDGTIEILRHFLPKIPARAPSA